MRARLTINKVKLIEHRGPSAFTTDLDLCILQAQAGHIIFSAIERGEDCFLNTPDWVRFFDSFGEPGMSSRLTSEMQVLRLYAPWPDLMNGYCRLIKAYEAQSDEDAATNTASTPGSISAGSPSLLEEQGRIGELTDFLNAILRHRVRLLEWTADWNRRMGDKLATVTTEAELEPLQLGFRASLAQCLIFLDCMAARTLDDLPEFMLIDAKLLPDTYYRSVAVKPFASTAQARLIDEAWDALADVKVQLQILRSVSSHSHFGTQKAMRVTMNRIWPFHKPLRAAAAIHEMADELGYYRAPYLPPEMAAITDSSVAVPPPRQCSLSA